MSLLGTHTKQPAEELDYDIECADWLPAGDSLFGATVTAITGLTVLAPMISGTKVKVWVQGGTHGTTYKVEVTITTNGGRVKQVEFKVKVKEV